MFRNSPNCRTEWNKRSAFKGTQNFRMEFTKFWIHFNSEQIFGFFAQMPVNNSWFSLADQAQVQALSKVHSVHTAEESK